MKMKKKQVWYLVGVLIVGLALLAVSCGGGVSAPAEKEEPTAEETVVEETVVEETVVEETVVEETPVAAGPPDTPTGHATASCLMCHEQGIGNAPQWPDGHTGFTEEICASCHQSAE